MASSKPANTPASQTHDGDTMSRLAALPEELISNIAVRFDCDDQCSFRLSCKAIEAKSFHDFATEYFSGKCFMITTESLRVLVGISNNARLRSYLRDIYIVTALFSDQAFNCPNGCQCAWQPTVRQTEAHRTYTHDQKNLVDSGDDKVMLLSAMRNLANVQSMRLVDAIDCFSQTIDTAGLRKVIRRTGRPPTSGSTNINDAERTKLFSHAWKVMIHTIAESGTDTITALENRVASYNNGLSVSRDLFFGRKTLTALRKALVNLKHLRLTIRGSTLVKKNNAPDAMASAKRMRQLATVLTAPEELCLRSDCSPDSGMLLYSFVRDLRLSGLTKLALDMVVLDAGSLASILAPMNSVKTVKLSWINLTDGTWVAILKMLQKLTTLDHLHLMWLQESSRKAYFLNQPEYPDPAAGDWDDVGNSDAEAEADVTDTEAAQDSDDEIPDLEPGATFDNPIELQPGLAFTGVGPAEEQAHVDDGTAEESNMFVAPGHEDSPERGYYVCLRDEQIAKYLPIFIQEYNVGDSLEDAMAAGLGGPGGLNVINALTNMLGPLPLPPFPLGAAPPGFAGGAPGGQAPTQGGQAPGQGSQALGQGGQALGQGGQAPAHGAGGGIGLAGPPGFVTLGSIPGYQMLMGTMPMPAFPPYLAQPAATAPNATQSGQQGSATGAVGNAPSLFGSLANILGGGGAGLPTGGNGGAGLHTGLPTGGNGGVAVPAHAETEQLGGGNGVEEREEHDEFLEEDGFEEVDESEKEGGTMLTGELD
ncbi:hypothetical protein LTR36_001411 [Oleoguttula mirabilis]|uniref:F-box domain-containing protein n=1 Tax=Oleoguttula mirabilis TaxID=1507867 RepID=A0AAV9JP75_9PEZI|nr:hypothetical protein LTR36_001411 [Oleoguttula mirabilis]